jgi:hypothetical protein
MLKYLAKISMDIFPSVLATIIGAYIVNHYINAKPATDAPAAAMAPAQPQKGARPTAKPTDVANLPAPGVKAKGVSEKAVSDKPAEVKPAEVKPAEAKPAEAKPADTKPADSAAVPAEPAAPANPRVHQAPREKATAKVTPPAAPAVEPNVAPSSNPSSATPDANDLARAAIERLRKTTDKTPEAPAQESARAAEPPHVQEAPRVVTAAPPAVRPLPPPITVSAPASEAYGTQQPTSPPYTASVGREEANRPTPPADIPVPIAAPPPPLDLRADAAGPAPRAKTNVADEMLSGMKSMFEAVLPKPATPD